MLQSSRVNGKEAGGWDWIRVCSAKGQALVHLKMWEKTEREQISEGVRIKGRSLGDSFTGGELITPKISMSEMGAIIQISEVIGTLFPILSSMHKADPIRSLRYHIGHKNINSIKFLVIKFNPILHQINNLEQNIRQHCN